MIKFTPIEYRIDGSTKRGWVPYIQWDGILGKWILDIDGIETQYDSLYAAKKAALKVLKPSRRFK